MQENEINWKTEYYHFVFGSDNQLSIKEKMINVMEDFIKKKYEVKTLLDKYEQNKIVESIALKKLNEDNTINIFQKETFENRYLDKLQELFNGLIQQFYDKYHMMSIAQSESDVDTFYLYDDDIENKMNYIREMLQLNQNVDEYYDEIFKNNQYYYSDYQDKENDITINIDIDKENNDNQFSVHSIIIEPELSSFEYYNAKVELEHQLNDFLSQVDDWKDELNKIKESLNQGIISQSGLKDYLFKNMDNYFLNQWFEKNNSQEVNEIDEKTK